jgi:hypothetical protein
MVCQVKNAICFVRDNVTRYPPFLYVEVESTTSSEELVQINDHSYELICSIFGNGFHFVCYVRLPDSVHGTAGVYTMIF